MSDLQPDHLKALVDDDAALRRVGDAIGRGAIAHLDKEFHLWQDVLPRAVRSSLKDHLQTATMAAITDERERIASMVEARGKNNLGMVHPVDAALAQAIRAGATQ